MRYVLFGCLINIKDIIFLNQWIPEESGRHLEDFNSNSLGNNHLIWSVPGMLRGIQSYTPAEGRERKVILLGI